MWKDAFGMVLSICGAATHTARYIRSLGHHTFGSVSTLWYPFHKSLDTFPYAWCRESKKNIYPWPVQVGGGHTQHHFSWILGMWTCEAYKNAAKGLMWWYQGLVYDIFNKLSSLFKIIWETFNQNKYLEPCYGLSSNFRIQHTLVCSHIQPARWNFLSNLATTIGILPAYWDISYLISHTSSGFTRMATTSIELCRENHGGLTSHFTTIVHLSLTLT